MVGATVDWLARDAAAARPRSGIQVAAADLRRRGGGALRGDVPRRARIDPTAALSGFDRPGGRRHLAPRHRQLAGHCCDGDGSAPGPSRSPTRVCDGRRRRRRGPRATTASGWPTPTSWTSTATRSATSATATWTGDPLPAQQLRQLPVTGPAADHADARDGSGDVWTAILGPRPRSRPAPILPERSPTRTSVDADGDPRATACDVDDDADGRGDTTDRCPPWRRARR